MRDSCLSGSNQACVVVGMLQQICHRHRKTAGNKLSRLSQSTHIHCEVLNKTFIPLLLLRRSKELPDQSGKKSDKTGS